MKGVWMAAVCAVGLGLGAGCTSVKIAQRDGCWVRTTTRFPKQVSEELGPCTRPEPKWSNDRVARLVQECMAQSDYRWRNRAVEAWMRHEPLPPQESEQKTLNACMSEAANTLVTENETLKRRLSEVTTDRDALKSALSKDGDFLRESHDRLTDALGEAAKKPAPSAVATATSEGKANTQSDLAAQPAPATVTAIPVPLAPQAPPQPAALCPAPKRTSRGAVANKDPKTPPSCDGVGGSGKPEQVKADAAKLVDSAAPTAAKKPDAPPAPQPAARP